MYKGVCAPAVGIIFQNGILFGIQRSTMSLLQPEGGPIKITNSVLGGVAAGFFQSFILSPVELVKLRMQMQGIGKWEVFFEFDGHHSSPGAHKHYNNLWDCCSKVYRTEKLRGIYRGCGITILRDVVGFAVYFGLFDYLCQHQAKRKGISIDELSIFNLVMIGGTSGLLSWIPNYPMDVIKTRIQADGVQGKNKYSGIIDCCRKAYHNDGVATFFKGMNPTLIRAFPTNAAIFSTFVIVERWIRNHLSLSQT